MFGSKVSKNYRSEFDIFFHEFDSKRKKLPESRIKEIKKHEAIFKKRDNAIEEEDNTIWKDF